MQGMIIFYLFPDIILGREPCLPWNKFRKLPKWLPFEKYGSQSLIFIVYIVRMCLTSLLISKVRRFPSGILRRPLSRGWSCWLGHILRWMAGIPASAAVSVYPAATVAAAMRGILILTKYVRNMFSKIFCIQTCAQTITTTPMTNNTVNDARRTKHDGIGSFDNYQMSPKN